MPAGVARFRIPTSGAALPRGGKGIKEWAWSELTGWRNGLNSADARFLMVTAITHHRFSSPIWGAREVRKLQAELAEIAKHAAEILKEHQAARQEAGKKTQRRPRPKYRGVFGAPAW